MRRSIALPLSGVARDVPTHSVYLRGQAEACPGDGFLLVSLQLGGARQRGHLVPLPLCLELGSALERLKL